MTPDAQALSKHIGFVSTRLAGTDGVSLEVAKWVHVLNALNYECFAFSGESDWPAERSYIVPEAHFVSPEIQVINGDVFGKQSRSPETSARTHRLTKHLKEHLRAFVKRFDIALLITENALSLPMNIPLGLALTEFIAETGIPTIGHHHDFAWERERYNISAADDYLRTAFPPVLPSVRHVVINSFAARQVALRTGMSSALIPNVMDFDNPPSPPDDVAHELRDALGLRPGQLLILQPTRIVPRKHIERAIELVRWLQADCVLVISHRAGDEGAAYAAYLEYYASVLGVRMIQAADVISHERSRNNDGAKTFSLADAYQMADLVTYPSRVEGFGNAFLETIYYRRPILMGAYEIFNVDIQPKGFKVVSFDDFISQDTIHQAQTILFNPSEAAAAAELNYELGRRYYSYRTLESRLASLLTEGLGRA